ncbi:endonuclease V [Flavobacterium suaedae]|uniref:Endonuclease V n=1 Tax=Flavobacterium suaedae TaxID=1767027 RepID=A0ABQ1K649_9FLAO|nr:endonuclease V [Flavobacterium suaedae]GGB84695.1 endonuclease V [Flavobacterium suaedae]
MILAFDTYYYNEKAKTVCLLFDKWDAAEPKQVFTEIRDNANEYIPGEFYKKELPCITALLEKIDLTNIKYIVVDGYAILDDEGKYGLGGHLYNYLEEKIPVIGVGKTNFQTVEERKREVLRGESKNPLYVTAVGIDVDTAAEYIKQMYGKYRMPTLLKKLDTLTKEI